jgi:aspartate aminotransferase-like enzyme
LERPEIIMAPGPTPIPPEVLLAQAKPLVYHRGPGFGDLLRKVTEDLQALYKTKNDVLIWASSGTGGLECAVVNLFSPGDRVVVPVAGFFGERFVKLATAYGLDVRRVDFEWGETVRVEEVAAALAEAPTKGLLVQQSETSTGVMHDIEAISTLTRGTDVLLVVDCVSSVGAVPFETDLWEVDAAVGGSQKAISAAPGLSFVAISEKAWAANKVAKCPRFYWDWAAFKASYGLTNPESPFTPAISTMQGLAAGLKLYMDSGMEENLARHELLSRATKTGIEAIGLELFGEGRDRAWAVTAVRAPEGLDGDAIVDKVRADHGIVLAPGQGPLKGKVFRIGHFGYFDKFDIIRCLAALELTLQDMGFPVELGSGVAAAERIFSKG